MTLVYNDPNYGCMCIISARPYLVESNGNHVVGQIENEEILPSEGKDFLHHQRLFSTPTSRSVQDQGLSDTRI